MEQKGMIKLNHKAFNKGFDDVVFMRPLRRVLKRLFRRKPTRRYRPKPDLIHVDLIPGIDPELQRILRGGKLMSSKRRLGVK